MSGERRAWFELESGLQPWSTIDYSVLLKSGSHRDIVARGSRFPGGAWRVIYLLVRRILDGY